MDWKRGVMGWRKDEKFYSELLTALLVIVGVLVLSLAIGMPSGGFAPGP